MVCSDVASLVHARAPAANSAVSRPSSSLVAASARSAVQLRTPTGYCKDPPASEHPMRHGWHRRCHAMSRVAYRHHGPVARRTYSCVGAWVVVSSDDTITTRERAFSKLHFMVVDSLTFHRAVWQIDKSVSLNVMVQ